MTNIRNIVILGGGSAGWMSAASLSNAFGETLSIRLIESAQIGTVGVGEATIPAIKSFNKLLGIDEREFMSATQATFKLGIQFENWGDVGVTYMHPFGPVGKDSWIANFLHFWLKARRQGIAREYWDYSLNIRASAARRFKLDLAAGLDYAYHFDASRYAAFLRRYSEVRGVVRTEGTVDHVKLDPHTGHIQSLRLASGEEVPGDLFIDCSGFRAVLIDKTLHAGFEDWSHWLPCDSALAVQTDSVEAPVPYTRSTAHGAGWLWRIPLQHRVGNGLVYCSSYLDEAAAHERLLTSIQGKLRVEPRLIRFRTGRARQQWYKNCVAIGLSSGFIEPLESTSLHLIQSGIVRLIRMLPGGTLCASQIAEYNRQSCFEYERIRDFVMLHYHINRRQDTDFWRYCRTMSIPDTLARKIALFEESGSVFNEQDELFLERSWQQVMLGQGMVPRHYHPVVDKLSQDELVHLMDSIDMDHQRRLETYPHHDAFIADYCRGTD